MICLECTIILWTVGVMNVEMHCHQTGELVVDKNWWLPMTPEPV